MKTQNNGIPVNFGLSNFESAGGSNKLIEIGDIYCLNPEYNSINHVRVLEALPGGVKSTRIDSFLNYSFDYNNNPKVIVGRLKDKYKYAIPEAIEFAKKQIGKEYDEI